MNISDSTLATRSDALGPNIIGIGAQKCASTWMHTAMGLHPQIGASTPKEIHFFSNFFNYGFDWYEAKFASIAAKPIRFEASPSYFHDPRAPERIRNYNPKMQLIVLFRDPVERAYSSHLHEINKAHISPMPFSQGLKNNPEYIEQGRYATHLERWLKIFPRDQILVMFTEEIAKDPAAAAKTAYAFVGADTDFESSVLRERRNESDKARLPVLRQGLRAGGRLLRRFGLEERLASLKKSGPVARMMSANSVDLRQTIPPMDSDSRAYLEAVFAPEIAGLQVLLGRDSLPWKSAGNIGAR